MLTLQQCVASSYLSFFFTDCLMSRWLLNYTPQATIVRLLAISALNGWCTWGVLYLTGGSEDPRLLLPGWIVISTVRVPLPLPSCHQPDRPLDPHPPLPPNPTQNQHPQGNPRLHLSLLHRLLHLHGRPPRPAALQPHRLSRHPARHFSVAGLGGHHGAGAQDYGVWECDEGSLTRLFRFVLFRALFEGVILDLVKLPFLFSFSVSFFCFFFLFLFLSFLGSSFIPILISRLGLWKRSNGGMVQANVVALASWLSLDLVHTQKTW